MKHLHEEAWLIGSMCLSKPHQCEHTANEQASILTACNVTSQSSFQLRIKITLKLCRLQLATVMLRVKKGQGLSSEVQKSVFCLQGHAHRQYSSQANWPISRQLSRQSGTQRCLSWFDPQSAASSGVVKVQVSSSLPATKRAPVVLMSA